MVLYSIYDKVSDTYGPLSSGLNEDVVKRNLRLSVLNDPVIKNCISDYFLCFFGKFNERSGEIELTRCDLLSTIPFSEILEVSSDV